MHVYTNNNDNIPTLSQLQHKISATITSAEHYLRAKYAALDPRLWFRIKAALLRCFNPVRWLLLMLGATIAIAINKYYEHEGFISGHTLNSLLTGVVAISFAGISISVMVLNSFLALHELNTEWFILLDDIERLVVNHTLRNLPAIKVPVRQFWSGQSDAQYRIVDLAKSAGASRIYRVLNAHDGLHLHEEKIVLFTTLQGIRGREENKDPLPNEIILKILSYLDVETTVTWCSTVSEALDESFNFPGFMRQTNTSGVFQIATQIQNLVDKSPYADFTVQYKLFATRRKALLAQNNAQVDAENVYDEELGLPMTALTLSMQ